ISIDDKDEVKETRPISEKDDLLIKSVAPGYNKETRPETEEKKEVVEVKPVSTGPKVLGKIELEKPKEKKSAKNESPKEEVVVEENKTVSKKKTKEKTEEPVVEEKAPKVIETVKTETEEIGVKIVGHVSLEDLAARENSDNRKKGRKDTQKEKGKSKKKEAEKTEDKISEETAVVSEVEPTLEISEPVIEATSEISEEIKEEGPEFYKTDYQKLEGPTILGKMDLGEFTRKDDKKKPVASSSTSFDSDKKKKRKRIKKEGSSTQTTPTTGEKKDDPTRNKTAGNKQHTGSNRKPPFRDRPQRVEPTAEEVQKQIKETLARLSSPGKSKTSKYRRMKREAVSQQIQENLEKQESEKNILKVTEFVTANELATMMNVPVTKVIQTCMSLGMFVSINQRLDAEMISIVADEFGYQLEFVSVEVQEALNPVEKEIDVNDTTPRSPIVTVMGHVDHGKTSLLDYIRKANVIAGEAGGITQHIGAYEVQLENGKKITFLDTPGHEAFTAMRARGANMTDIVIIVVAADDNVMPQTKEAINHAQAAGVPIIIAINKIDKPSANVEKIREELAQLNILVEDWGGKYQCQEISAKFGQNVDLLLEKVLLEAELLDLKSNPDRLAFGSVIESTLDKGRGYIATMLVQNGTMRVGEIVLAGCQIGRVKAMFNERGQKIETAGPSTPVVMLGLDGAPQAGDKFNVLTDEKEAKNLAVKRQQLQREQGIRTQKHITLDEIGRRIAIGNFRELNAIVKGDVDGSVEALSDSLLKLSTPKVQVNVIHKSVGMVTESDVLLAAASDAIIIAFQVRPSLSARKLAEAEQIDIRTYSIIYDAINEVKAAMEGMLAPEFEEKIVCNVEIRDVFKITKVGTVAGCYVLDGKISRHTKIRLIRDGIVIYTGTLASLKRFKDDAKEVSAGYECGLNVTNFNDIKEGDILEGYDEIQVKAKL
ncbi:MAG: translation initiation factor IF-2, partial [Bacteroidota bacterium]